MIALNVSLPKAVLVSFNVFLITDLISLFSSPHFPKREKSGLLNNLQKLVHAQLTSGQVTHLQLA